MPVSKRKLAGRVMLAANLYDLDRVPEMIRECLNFRNVFMRMAVTTDPDRVDEAAIPFRCDLLTAACICDMIRTHDRGVKDYPTRVYIRKKVAWEKVPANINLTTIEDGDPVLNPVVFGGGRSPLPAIGVPLKAERLTF